MNLHDVLAPHVESGEIPGLVGLVARDGSVHVEAIGRRYVDGPPITRDSIFRISSMTKPIVAVATLQLVEQGALALDEPVDRLLPELVDRRVLTAVDAELDDTVPADRPITVRDLLTFRLGYGMIMADPDTHPILRAMNDLGLAQGPPGAQTPPAPDEWIRRLGTLPLLHQPGGRWTYNTGSDVLGVLVARAAGAPLAAGLHERVFAPLGMRDTGFHVPAAGLDRLVTAYGAGPVPFDEPATGYWSREPAFPPGACGLVSTVDDYLAFSEMLRLGGSGILSPESVAQMTIDQLGPGQSDPMFLGDGGWGFGVTVDETGYGWAGGLGTSWSTGPGGTGILLTQVDWMAGPPAVVGDFWTAVYGA